MNADKLAKLQSSVRIGGKGTPRRKVKKVHKSAASDNQKMQSALKKLNAQPIPSIEEVNMFRTDGQVIHFAQPKGFLGLHDFTRHLVHAAIGSNTFVIGGLAEEKELTELAPGILSQLGPNALFSLKKMAEAYQAQAAAAGVSVEEFAKAAAAAGSDDQVPDLVESFESAEL